MPLPRELNLTLRQRERLERLWRRFAREPLPPDLPGIISEQFGVDLGGQYGARSLANPFMVASGDLTVCSDQVEKAFEAGWGGVVLKTAAVEDASGRCDLGHLRRSARPPISRYAPGDSLRARPVLRWDGRLFPGAIAEYAQVVREAANLADDFGAAVAASLAGPMPTGEDDPCLDAWRHTAALLRACGINAIEITFEPLEKTGGALPPDGMRHVLAAMGGAEVVARPPGGALSGLTCAAGVTAHGPDVAVASAAGFAVSTVGGVYTGLRALEHILAGALSVQVYSFLAGKVLRPVKRSLSKHEQVLYKLMLDPADGLVAGMLHLLNSAGVSSVREAAGRQETQ